MARGIAVGGAVRAGLRVTVNTLSVTAANEGLRTLVVSLVAALPRVDPVNRYRLVCSQVNEALFPAVEGVERVVLAARRRHPLSRIRHDQLTVPLLVRRGADVLITPSSVGSLVSPVPQVVIVAAHLAIPSVRRDLPMPTLSPAHRLYYGPVMRLSHRRASAVVPISEWLGEQLVAENHLDPALVTPVPCGVDLPEIRSVDERRGRPGSIVLFVSTLYPYKNASALVEAFAYARQKLPPDSRLVIVGRDPDGKQHDALCRLGGRLGLGDRLELTGKISDDELEECYRSAAVLVYPSLAEGFGLPVLEAMARGVPVIAADRTSLPEVVGKAGVLVDPLDTDSLAAALVQVLGHADLRDRLTRAGRAQAESMTWDRAAASLVEVIKRVGRPSESCAVDGKTP